MKKERLFYLFFFIGRWRRFYLVMRNCFFLFFLFNLSVSANMLSQHIVSLDLNDVSLKTCLKTIRHETGVGFLYSGREINKVKKISVNVTNERLDKILDHILLDNGFTYKISNEVILIQKSPEQIPEPVMIPENKVQEKSIQGVVSDEDGNPLPGVNVVVKGTSIGAITDANGHYFITVPLDSQTLEFSFVGMQTQEVTIGNSTVIDVSMQIAMEAMEEVVVTALGIKKELKSVGYATQELDANDLSAARELNLAGFLTGKVAGVQVSRTAGGATGSTSVTIRGNSSLTGRSQPLYVVDGVPIINEPKGVGGMFGGEHDYGDGIGDINPEDILSINVLKGPSASSLYGSRGANGVVLITTKSGGKRKGIGIEVNSNFAIETISMMPKTQNKWAPGWDDMNINGSIVNIDGVDYETYPSGNNYSWGPALDGTRTVSDPYLLPGEDLRPLTLLPQPENNINDFYDVGMSNQNTIAFSGGNETTSGRVSIGNLSYKGVIPNHKVDKQTISARLTSRISKFLTIEAQVNYMHTDGSQRPALGYSIENVNYVLSQMGRIVPLDFLDSYYQETGEPGRFPGLWGINPYYTIDALRNSDYRDRMIGYLSATVKFTDWLSLLGRVSLDSYTEYREKTWPIGSTSWDYPNGGITTELNHIKDLNADLMLMANKQLSENLSVNATLGANLLKQNRDRINVVGQELRARDVYHISNANIVTPYQSLYQKEMQSVFFTGQIGYKNYLYLDVTGRNDWSSTLGLNEQSYFYPSVSTSFIFSEAFNINTNLLSFGKVRVSWAQVGNDSDPYLTKFGYVLHSDSYNGQGFISTPGQVPLLDLKNELTESWEIGTDLRFFNNKLSFDVTYYNGHTTNQIIPANISSTSGYETVIINAGQIDNKGIEAVIRVSPFRSPGGFNWDISFNYSRNRNTIVELAEGIDGYVLNDGYIGNALSINAIEGRPFGDIYGLQTKTSPDGEYIVSSRGRYVRADETSLLGNIQPDWIGGLNNTFSYKGFSMNLLFDFVQGGNLFSMTKHEMTSRGTGIWTEVGRGAVLPGVNEVLDGDGNVTGYTENEIVSKGQDYWMRRARGPGHWFVLDASYIMLREALLSYRFQPTVLDKTPFANVTLSLVGRNLFYLEEHMEDMGISPESSPNTNATYCGYETFSAPSTRTFALNIKLIF